MKRVYVCLSLFIPLLCSCILHVPVRPHAPGKIDIYKPPKAPVGFADVEEPEDSGADGFVMSGGLLVWDGWYLDPANQGELDVGGLDIELSVYWCIEDWDEQPKKTGLDLYPRWTLGLNVGFNLYRPVENSTFNSFYVEAQLAFFGTGIAFGYTRRTLEELHGFQASMTLLGGFYLRWIYLSNGNWEILYGLNLKLPVLFSWRR